MVHAGVHAYQLILTIHHEYFRLCHIAKKTTDNSDCETFRDRLQERGNLEHPFLSSTDPFRCLQNVCEWSYTNYNVTCTYIATRRLLVETLSKYRLFQWASRGICCLMCNNVGRRYLIIPKVSVEIRHPLFAPQPAAKLVLPSIDYSKRRLLHTRGRPISRSWTSHTEWNRNFVS